MKGTTSTRKRQATIDSFYTKKKSVDTTSNVTCSIVTSNKDYKEKAEGNAENRTLNVEGTESIEECNEVLINNEGSANGTVDKHEEEECEQWISELGESWYEALKKEIEKPYFKRCIEKAKKERNTKKVYPPEHLVFNAFKLTPLSKIKVVIIGQDPYHQPKQAMGLSFSVPEGVPCPPSLRNIFKEIGIRPQHGDLTTWAEQGVFLLNSLLSVVESAPMSHKDLGWEQFTDHVVHLINEKCDKVVFLLWGKPAQKKAARVDTQKHYILSCGHPSPLSVRFFTGCQHFTKCNEILRSNNKEEINWESSM